GRRQTAIARYPLFRTWRTENPTIASPRCSRRNRDGDLRDVRRNAEFLTQWAIGGEAVAEDALPHLLGQPGRIAERGSVNIAPVVRSPQLLVEFRGDRNNRGGSIVPSQDQGKISGER